MGRSFSPSGSELSLRFADDGSAHVQLETTSKQSFPLRLRIRSLPSTTHLFIFPDACARRRACPPSPFTAKSNGSSSSLARKFMGTRFSASQSATAISSPHPTAKVITPEGQLREYSGNATTVWLALADCSVNSSSFLCDADALFFDEPVPPMPLEDPVLPGRLYFVLPGEMSRHPLYRADMGALAVRAASALRASPPEGKKRGTNKSKIHPTRKCSGKCRVAPMLQQVVFGNDGDVYFKSGSKQHQRAPASSLLRINGETAHRHRQAAVAGKKRKVARRVSFREKLGTISEEAVD